MTAEEVAAKVARGEHVKITDIAQATLTHPEYFREIARQRQAVTVGEKLMRDEYVPITEVVSVAQEYPGVLAQVAEYKQRRRKVVTRTTDILAKAEKGEKLPITDISFLALHYPKDIEQFQTQASQIRQSKQFYEQIGYPQYAGKYAPFQVPADHAVKTITETPKGLQITFMETRKGLAEQMMEYEVTPLAARIGLQKPSFPIIGKKAKTKPLAGFAGMVASAESIVYTVGRLAGLKTPRLPPTVLSLRHEEAVGFGAEYAAGTIMGDVFIGQAIGRGVSKLASPLTSRISSRASTWLTSKYAGEPLAWKGIRERVVMRLTGARPYMAPGVVSFPTPPAVGLKGLEAQQLAWELIQAPKTTGLTLAKAGAKKTVFTFTKGIGYTPMSVTLAKAMGVEQMGGRQALLQITKPKLKTTPFIPSPLKFLSKTTPAILSQILGLATLGAVTSLQTGRTAQIQRLPIPSVTGLLTPFALAAQSQELKALTMPVAVQEATTTQTGVTTQLQHQIPSDFFAPPTFLRETGVSRKQPFPFEFSRSRKSKKEWEKLFGEWFYRKHPIVKPSKVFEQIIGAPSKNRRRRKR